MNARCCCGSGIRDVQAQLAVVLLKYLALHARFLESFEAVFGDADWEATLDNVRSEHLIRPGATFLEPRVPDESANWANRGALLRLYRELLVARARLEACTTARALVTSPEASGRDRLQ